MLTLNFPFPISANNYWQIVGKRLIKTKKARLFITEVTVAWLEAKVNGCKSFNENDDLALAVAVHYPTKKGPDTDLDNLCKVLIDAMETAQIFPNDKQFRHIQLTREPFTDKIGGVRVTIQKCKKEMILHDDTFKVKGIHKSNVRWDNKINGS